ncbi:MAG: flavin reductase family protein [Planctomyces sp.]|jgi:flavin reductase (DIM6/NTAB) family NADH-FMN oxidoreductase RutF
MDLDPEQLHPNKLYLHLVRTIMPRPIAWVSTVSPTGVLNLAPYSFFCGVGSRPPTLLFCPANRRDGSPKDSLANTLAREEFVVNMVPYSLAREMQLTSSELSPEESEFELAGLDTADSVVVSVPRVRLSPVSFECRLLQHLALGAGPGGANIVIGRIVHMHIDDAALNDTGFADPELLDLVGRLGGTEYCRIRDRFDLGERP